MTIKELTSKAGKASANKRFQSKSKKQISELMRKVRLSKTEKKEVNNMVNEVVENLRKNTKSS
jgi:Glu-tRNA(Gln) amidotransferase subunit E-like FAD-binding protein